MDYKTFVEEARHKRRNIADLARFISTRTDNNPNYTLLFGAGCSVTSGVRSAMQLSAEWRAELYRAYSGEQYEEAATEVEQRQFLRTHESSWYDESREYSSLFEKRFDLQRQRRMFVEKEVAGKTPSIGYAYLTTLIEQNYFNTIFTTNFDDILNEAFYAYSTLRPIVCAHDSSINSITVTSKRPKIIKIHGDYLFDDLKSTLRETENLEQNMKAKFSEFAKDYGLVVVGYSGGDRSVMDTIATLLRNEEYLKNGVYWCLRAGSEISEELRKLIWRDRVYFVEVPGFDELFAELYSIFNGGEVLPRSATGASRRPQDLLTKLLSSETAFPTTSEILVRARERLQSQSKRSNLLSVIANAKGDGFERPFSNDGLEDDELMALAEMQNLMHSGAYEESLAKGLEVLRGSPGLRLKLRTISHVATCHVHLDQRESALRYADQLIDLQPRQALPYLFKASLCVKHEDELACIESAISANPFSVSARIRKAGYFLRKAREAFGADRQMRVQLAQQELDRGLQLDPSIRNQCWAISFDLIETHVRDKTQRHQQQSAIVEKLNSRNPYSLRVLTLRQRMLNDESPRSEVESLLADLATSRERNAPDNEREVDHLELKIMATSTHHTQELERKIEEQLRQLKTTCRDSDLAVEVADILRKRFGRDDEAIKVLSATLDYEFDGDAFVALIFVLVDTGQESLAQRTFSKWRSRLTAHWQSVLLTKLLESKGELRAALAEVRSRKTQAGSAYDFTEGYLLLRLREYREAQEHYRSFLQEINFTPEASAEVINFELARKLSGAKVNSDRVQAAISLGDPRVAVGGYALLGKRAELFDAVRKLYEQDRTFRFEVRDWPVLDEFREDADFKKLMASPFPGESKTRLPPANLIELPGRQTEVRRVAS